MTVAIPPIIKAIAPYLAQVATAAVPAFTSRAAAIKAETPRTNPLVAKQIEELQFVATRNAESIHLLAEKMQLGLEAIESAAREVRSKWPLQGFALRIDWHCERIVPVLPLSARR